MQNEVVFSSFKGEDRMACLAVFSSNVPEFFLDSERAEFEAFLTELPGPYLTLRSSSSIVGCGGYAFGDREGVADLCWGMIDARYHGRGLGTLLTRARLDLALQDPEVRRVALSTSHKTVGFYERFGFRTLSTEPDGFGPGLHRCNMMLEAT